MPYGVVKEVCKNLVTVMMERQDMCGECHACEMLSGKKVCTLTCQSTIPCKVGDRVEVALTNKRFLKATYIVYGIPLLGFIMGTALGYGLAHVIPFGGEDLWVAIGAVIGTLTGVGYIKWADKKEKYEAYLPHIIRKEV